MKNQRSRSSCTIKASTATIITTYRRPILLKRAIHSVLQQTHPYCEVYIYDNNSGDDTESVVTALGKKDSRIKYYRHPTNIGMMANYQFAFENITSDYFSFLSDDDFYLPCFYETALKGFELAPQAAFSACGILQIDEMGNYVGDPLSLWQREGYYSPGDGLIEMLKTRWKFPIPNGILFQKKMIGDLKPNFNNEIDFFWDPIFLTTIAANRSIVITKNHCGIHLCHSNSFAYSFYGQLIQNSSLGSKYLKATRVLLEGIQKAPSLSKQQRTLAKNLFKDYVKKDLLSLLATAFFLRKLGTVHHLCKQYYRFYNPSFRILLFHFLAGSSHILRRASLVRSSLTTRLSSLLNSLLNRIVNSRRLDHKCGDMAILEKAHVYGQALLTNPNSFEGTETAWFYQKKKK